MIWKKYIKKFIIISFIVISFIDYLMLDPKLKMSCQAELKTLIYNIDQSLILIFEIIQENISDNNHV